MLTLYLLCPRKTSQIGSDNFFDNHFCLLKLAQLWETDYSTVEHLKDVAHRCDACLRTS